MKLKYGVSADHRTVRGSESVQFRPDKPITEVVFRLTANTKSTVRSGNRITVTAARASAGPATLGASGYEFSAANADPSTQGGLLRVTLGRTVAAGTTVTAFVDFTLVLGNAAVSGQFDRVGSAGAFAYFGSGEPLLAWERGYGWHTEDLINFLGESATSEAMDVDLQVEAPLKDTVIASGNPLEPQAVSAGARTWRSHLAAARDVSVAVGPFAVSDTTVAGVRLRVGGYDAAIRDALVPEFRRAITLLVKRYGPFPFPSLAVARVPANGGGIEYPGSILMLDSSRVVAVHETAHQYFYAMLGDSQAMHPWLDEAFAEYAEEVEDGSASSHEGDLTRIPNPVDSSIQSFGMDGATYTQTVYGKGSAALEAARVAAGPAKWDAAMCRYVSKNAWRIVHPEDFAAAIADLPAGLAVLRRAGAVR
ncbi:MAG: peptidase M1 [Actinomycetota bacterium]|nr:peptidase M1 [Actinomycetota bacterium]